MSKSSKSNPSEVPAVLSAVAEASETVALLSGPAQSVLALFTNPAVKVDTIKGVHGQEIGEMIGAEAMTAERMVEWCKKHYKGFPHEVRAADEKAIKAGLQKFKLALDKWKGRDVELVEIGKDRWITMDEALRRNPDCLSEGVKVFNASGAAIMAMSGKKVGKMPKGKGTLHSFIAPRKKAVQTYVSNRYNNFLAMAVRLEQQAAVEAAIQAGKEPPVDARPVVTPEQRIAKVFAKALQAAADEEFGVFSAETVQAAIDNFWNTLGIAPPEVEAKKAA